MKLSRKIIGFAVPLSLMVILALAQDRGAGQSVPAAGPGAGAGQQRRVGNDPVDDRVQLREYHFKDTDEVQCGRLPIWFSFTGNPVI